MYLFNHCTHFRGMEFITRYFFLIVFNAYLSDASSTSATSTSTPPSPSITISSSSSTTTTTTISTSLSTVKKFSQWLKERPEIHSIIEELKHRPQEVYVENY